MVMMGAPTMTPTAYPVTSSPAVGTETAKVLATWCSSPTITNSVVPTPKVPSARASSASGTALPPDDRIAAYQRYGAAGPPRAPPGHRSLSQHRDSELPGKSKQAGHSPLLAHGKR